MAGRLFGGVVCRAQAPGRRGWDVGAGKHQTTRARVCVRTATWAWTVVREAGVTVRGKEVGARGGGRLSDVARGAVWVAPAGTA